MADVFKFFHGHKLEEAIAELPGVQVALGKYAFEIKAYADVFLVEHRAEDNSFIELRRWRGGRGGGSGYDVVLNDENGNNPARPRRGGAAYNIEKGRKVEFYDDETGLPMGEMEPLLILTRAVQIVADRHRSELR